MRQHLHSGWTAPLALLLTMISSSMAFAGSTTATFEALRDRSVSCPDQTCVEAIGVARLRIREFLELEQMSEARLEVVRGLQMSNDRNVLGQQQASVGAAMQAARALGSSADSSHAQMQNLLRHAANQNPPPTWAAYIVSARSAFRDATAEYAALAGTLQNQYATIDGNIGALSGLGGAAPVRAAPTDPATGERVMPIVNGEGQRVATAIVTGEGAQPPAPGAEAQRVDPPAEAPGVPDPSRAPAETRVAAAPVTATVGAGIPAPGTTTPAAAPTVSGSGCGWCTGAGIAVGGLALAGGIYYGVQKAGEESRKTVTAAELAANRVVDNATLKAEATINRVVETNLAKVEARAKQLLTDVTVQANNFINMQIAKLKTEVVNLGKTAVQTLQAEVSQAIDILIAKATAEANTALLATLNTLKAKVAEFFGGVLPTLAGREPQLIEKLAYLDDRRRLRVVSI